MKRFGAVFSSLLIVGSLFMNIGLVDAVGTNLIANPSVEDATNNLPTSWKQDKYGTNTSAFSYDTTGHTGGRSVTVKTTSYTSGDAKWYPNAVNVSPSTSYAFNDWYKSTSPSSVDAVITTTTGKTTYKYLGSVAASSDWKQASFSFKTPSNAKQITFYHYFTSVGQLTTDDYSLEAVTATPAPAPTAPTVSLTSPLSGANVTGSQSVTASVVSATTVTGVQFKLDGNNLGAVDTSAPYSVSWDTLTATNGNHVLSAVAANSANLSGSAPNVTVNVANVAVPTPTPPTVSITSPITGASVSGAQSVNASVTSATTVTGVQFKLDGNNLGAVDATAPYSISWDTSILTNGSHILSAVATNSANLSATAANVTVNVANVITPPTPVPTPSAGPNLIPNPSVDSSGNGVSPDSWIFSNWGANTTTSSYLSTGHSGAHSVRTEITSYTNGAANWYYADVPVVSGKTYKYENWYQSNVDTEVDAQVTMNDGSVQYYWLGNVSANTSWTKFSGSFSAPVGAKSMAIYQILAKKGYLVTDDYSLTEYTPAQLNRGIVSLTFDDGWRSIYSNGLPLLNKYGFASTQYLLSGTTDYPDYMTVAMMAEFRDQGSEIAGHTVNHLDLTKQTAATLNFELSNSKTSLQNWLGVPVNNFATPYGAYNSNVINAIKPLYRSHRSTDVGFNTKDSLDIYNIKVQNITNTTTPAQVKAWVDQAVLDKTWLVLVYHEVDAGAADPTYAVTPANLDQELNLIKQSGVAVRTVNQALDEILAQL